MAEPISTTSIELAAAVGCGVIGAGWIARLRLRGVDVRAYDPSPHALDVIDEVHANALDAWRALGIALNTTASGTSRCATRSPRHATVRASRSRVCPNGST